MCYLVTIGTLESRESVKALLGDDRLLAIGPSRNISIRSVFPKDDQLFEVTSGQCSCSLIVQDSSPPFEEKRARLQAQYERKGWSRAKIARALSDWENAHERTAKARNDPKERLCALLRVLGSRPGGVRVLVHFYSNAFDSEEIRVTGNFNIHVDQLIHTGVLTEDKLVGVLPQR